MQYSNVFNGHSIQAILGYTWQQKMNWESSMENYGFDSDFYKYNNMGSGTALKEGLADMTTYRSSSRYIAFFGRAIWNYKEKYLASVSLRRDGSSRFGKNQKWGWFPAVSLGWRITEEPWMENVEWLNELKLRAGFGVTGNQDFSNYKSLMLMSTGTSFYYNGEWINSYAPASNANPYLRWERKNEFNVGLDFSVLDNRLGGTLDYYYRLTTDLLYEYNVPVPPYDYKTLFTNVGSISNMGIELTLYATPVKTRDWVWNTTLVAAHNENKLIKFTNEEFQNQDYEIGWAATPVGAYLQRLMEGESLGSFYAPRYSHVGADGSDVLQDEFNGKINKAIADLTAEINKKVNQADYDVDNVPYILPSDATIPVKGALGKEPLSKKNRQLLVEQGLSVSEFCTMLTTVQAQSVTLFLDANFNGVQRDGEYLFPPDEKKCGSKKAKKTQALRIRGDVVVFCSSDFTATSYAFKEQEHGFFTYFLLKELKKSKGNLSYDDMFTNVKEAVSFESSLQGLQQIPAMTPGGKTKDTWTTMSFR